MAFLLDTCVLSEGFKPLIDPGVTAWLEATPNEARFVSVVSLAELQFGIRRLPTGKRKERFWHWYEYDLVPVFETRVLTFGLSDADVWARLRAEHVNASFADTQIAATALVHGLTIVTRNVRDFSFDSLSVFNPWRGAE
jgi:predicted nucleic acid-binding protein